MDLGHQIFVDPEQRLEFRREMEEAGIIRGHEYQVCRRDGINFWIAVDARAVRDETGAISYYEGFIQDITARKTGKAVLMTDLIVMVKTVGPHRGQVEGVATGRSRPPRRA